MYTYALLCLVTCLTLCDPMDCSPPGSSVHGDSPGKNNGVGCHALLQGIFLTQGSNPGLLHCRQMLYHLSHQRSPNERENVCHSVVSDSLQHHGLYPTRLLYPWDPPGKNTGVCCRALLQQIFQTQRLNPCPVQFSSVAQSCPTLCDPVNRSTPGSS